MEPLRAEPRWSRYFEGFTFPYGFHDPQAYCTWLNDVGLLARRVELIPKDMTQEGVEGLAGWIRTTWMPYTQCLPESLREAFIEELAARYTAVHPPDPDGHVHVEMARLEVEAVRHESAFLRSSRDQAPLD